MKKFILIGILYFLVSGASGQTKPCKPCVQITTVMSLQEKAWNNGNLDSFMLFYWNSPDLRFVSKNGVRKGWQAVYDSYKKNYSDKGEMGKLTFELKSIEPIGKDQALVVGSWQVLNASGILKGYFTLWFKKIDKEWRIVLDHTS